MPCLLLQQQVASVLSLSSSPSTHAPVVRYIAPAHTVFTPRHTGIGVLGASASTYAAPFATATGGLNSLPVEPTVYSCTCGDIFFAGTSFARCTLPLVGTCAGTISVLAPATVMVYIALAQAVSYAAQAQVLEYFAPAS